MTERQLIQRCRRGDREAQRELYAQTSQRIYGLLLKMTRHAEDARDLTHDTYVLAFQRMDQFDERGPLAAWLSRIAVNAALQFFRRSQRERLHLKLAPLGENAADSQDQHAEEMDLREALDKLDPTDRTILVLRYHQGLNYRQIADVMECPEGTVASRLNRAREKMHALLEDSQTPREETFPVRHLLRRRVSGDGA
jgi:RNA polymerase sigma-70 factor (ECF subfamily)